MSRGSQGPVRIPEEEVGCSVLLQKAVISVLPFVFACRIFEGAENVQSLLTVRILHFHLAVASDIDWLSYARCVGSVGEVISPSYFPPGNMCHHLR